MACFSDGSINILSAKPFSMRKKTWRKRRTLGCGSFAVFFSGWTSDWPARWMHYTSKSHGHLQHPSHSYFVGTNCNPSRFLGVHTQRVPGPLGSVADLRLLLFLPAEHRRGRAGPARRGADQNP